MKKTYINPEMEVVVMSMQQMLASSGVDITDVLLDEDNANNGDALIHGADFDFGDDGDDFDFSGV